MEISLKDIASLGRPLLAVGMVLAACGGGVYYTGQLLEQARKELAAARGELTEARKRVQQSGEERDMISTYVGPYTALVERGVIGEEQRLSWVDALREANNQAQLFGVEYEVLAQQPYSFTTEVQAGGLPVQQSLMKLKFGLLYEDDLLTFFRTLQAKSVGAFALNQCMIERLSREATRPANAPTLRAECELAWITIAAPPPEGSS
jgi:hypothetical protein